VSWLKLDDGFADHPKVLELSDAAFRLHVRALCWCARQQTDGVLTKRALAALSAKSKFIKELEGADLWHKKGDAHEVHDYLKYNPSKAQREAEREATRRRAERFRNGAANATGNGVTNGVSNRTPVPSRPVPEEKEPPTPGGPRPADPLADQLRGRAPEQRPDVLEVYDRLKKSTGKPHLKFRAPFDSAAKAIAVAIDADGIDHCRIVADFCMSDGMVNGKLDEQRQRHDSPEYIFGNTNAFHRILAAALAAGKGAAAPAKRSVRDAMAAAKAIGGDP